MNSGINKRSKHYKQAKEQYYSDLEENVKLSDQHREAREELHRIELEQTHSV